MAGKKLRQILRCHACLRSVTKAVHLCRYCGCTLVPYCRDVPSSATRQHVIPRRRGGSSRPENLRACCVRCNTLLEAADDCPALLQCALALTQEGAPDAVIKKVARTLRDGRPLDAVADSLRPV